MKPAATGNLDADHPPAVISLLVSLEELATMTGVSLKTCRRWHAERRIPGRADLPGRLIRYRRQAIIDWLSGRR